MRTPLTRGALLALSLALVVGLSLPFAVSADDAPETLQYLIGTGILCGLGPGACPVIAHAPVGDTVELTGEGTLNTETDVATGGGTFVHKNAVGAVVGTGSWTATELVSFKSFGSGAAQGLPADFWGGRAKMKVHLTPAGGGPGFDATLRVICTLGDDIPESAVEGARLNVRRGPNFKHEVSGFTVFIRLDS